MSVQDSGYLIVKQPSVIARDYATSEIARLNAKELRALREASSFLDPRRYRGVARSPLDPYPSRDPATIAAFTDAGLDMDTNQAARLRFHELVGYDRPDDEEEKLLPTVEQAREVLALLDVSTEWEIIYVAIEPLHATERTLGYDVGWWGGGFYSVIADSAVTPTWHPPRVEDFSVTADQLRGVNENVLFPTPEDALAFRDWYRRRSWAERDDDETPFRAIRVEAGEHASGVI